MRKLKVLIVDDSSIFRKVLTTLLSNDPGIEVVGTAANGKIGLEKIKELRPDVITLDLEMPEMDGLEMLVHLRKDYRKLPVIICSNFTKHGGESTLEALGRGADDYITKPSDLYSTDSAIDDLGESLIEKINALSWRISTEIDDVETNDQSSHANTSQITSREINVVAIGTSTGGPKALTELIPTIPADFPIPLLIVQHMPPMFTRLLAERLTAKGNILVKEAQDGDEIIAGQGYVAPGNYHMFVECKDNKKVIRLNQDAPENSCRPAVDVLFRSVANCYGRNSLAVIMTGMGIDGLLGSQAIHKLAGRILAQDEASSVVWGMPGAVVHAGLAQKVLPLNKLGKEIVETVQCSRWKRAAND